MKKVIIIDDEPLAASIIKEYMTDYPLELMAECRDGFEGLKAIQQHDPDLIFLDIQMPRINGFEMLELLEAPPAIIFTTAFEQYAIQAFEQNAIDYLLKPFSKERFGKSVDKFLQSGRPITDKDINNLNMTVAQQLDRIIVKEGSKIKVIPVPKIEYLEAADDYVKIFTTDGNFLKKQTMAFYEKSLQPYKFIRIHRSFIVNGNLITRIDLPDKDSYIVRLTNGQELPASKSGYARLKEVLGI